jgi:hypothetical protein
VSKKYDPDVLALKRAVKALRGSTSRRMVAASLAFLLDYFLDHPSKSLPEHLRPQP